MSKIATLLQNLFTFTPAVEMDVAIAVTDRIYMALPPELDAHWIRFATFTSIEVFFRGEIKLLTVEDDLVTVYSPPDSGLSREFRLYHPEVFDQIAGTLQEWYGINVVVDF